jgi:hypothetical protein
MSEIVAAEALRSALVSAGYSYWMERRGGQPMPARNDFDPLMEVPRLAPRMMLTDVRRDPLDFRYRLVGTGLRTHMNADWTGKWMSAIAFQRAPSTIWSYHQMVAESGLPLFIRPDYVGPHKDFLYVEAALLPMADDHRQVDMLMIFVDFLKR